MGGLSIAWYVGLTILSEDVLFDSIASLGLMIAFYGLTGYATPSTIATSCSAAPKHDRGRSRARRWRTDLRLREVLYRPGRPGQLGIRHSWFGIGSPLIIGGFFLVLGVVLMIGWRLSAPAFFRRRLKPTRAARHPTSGPDRVGPPDPSHRGPAKTETGFRAAAWHMGRHIGGRLRLSRQDWNILSATGAVIDLDFETSPGRCGWVWQRK